MASGKLRVAIVQMDIVLGEPDENRAHAADMVRLAAQNSDLVVLPEMWTTGYCLDRLRGGLADRALEPTGSLLASLAKECKTYIAGTVANERDGKVFNTMTVHGPDGKLASVYDKIHLVPMMDEEKWLAPGERLATCEMRRAEEARGEGGATSSSPASSFSVVAGLAICYDLRFPELFRSLALAGAEMFIMPAEWPAVRIAHWSKLIHARAIENQAFVVACNRVGNDGANAFPGGSIVVDPMGNVVAEADDREQIVRATLDLGMVDEFRSKVPVFKDRRPEAYRNGLIR